jgi:hypothetical protein
LDKAIAVVCQTNIIASKKVISKKPKAAIGTYTGRGEGAAFE